MVLQTGSSEYVTLRSEVFRTLSVGFGVLLCITAWLAQVLETGVGHILVSAVVYLVIAAAISLGLRLHLPHRRFGLANRISLIRAGIVAIICGFLVHPISDPVAAWTVFLLALSAMTLDGLDGMAARRTGMASALGARLDSELDGLLTLVLCVLAVLSERVGSFVLIAGSLHYGYLAARVSGVLPEVELPNCFRRRASGVTASILLALCIAPSAGAMVDTSLAVAAVALLGFSFAIDIALMFRESEAGERMSAPIETGSPSAR